jgi:hypothetical protein
MIDMISALCGCDRSTAMKNEALWLEQLQEAAVP